jgi:acyl-coenzyme A thioesterase PaaI-like protein
MSGKAASTPFPTPWRTFPPGRVIGRGHPAGDFLEAYDWNVLEQRPGYLKLDVHLPAHLRNPRGDLFGGYTPTYVDMVALRTVVSARAPTDSGDAATWLSTMSMRVDYLAPIAADRFVIEGEEMHTRKGTHLVEVRFRAADAKAAELLAFAVVTLRDVPRT